MRNYIYCIVNQNGELQRGEGSSQKTMFFITDKQCKKWAEWHTKHHPDDEWKAVKFALVPVEE